MSFPFVFQAKIRNEIDRRNGISRIGSDFDMCDEIMFDLFGVDRETLTNKWVKNPFLDVRQSSVKKARLSEPDERGEIEECVEEGDDVVSVAAEKIDIFESDALSIELRKAKLDLVREKTKWYRLQIEIAKMDLADRQSTLDVRSLVAQKEKDSTSPIMHRDHDYISKYT